MPIKVALQNRNPKKRINSKVLESAAVDAIEYLGFSDAEVNIIIVTSQRIRSFNREYFGRDRATDVIAWPSGELSRDNAPRAGEKSLFLGDIAVSTDRAEVNARLYGVSRREETIRYIIHGILHLAGYVDHTDKDRNIMRRTEDEIIEKNIAGFRR